MERLLLFYQSLQISLKDKKRKRNLKKEQSILDTTEGEKKEEPLNQIQTEKPKEKEAIQVLVQLVSVVPTKQWTPRLNEKGK